MASARSPLRPRTDHTVTGQGLSGHLRLVCALDCTGRSHLREQSFRAPLHISKPHHDAGALVVNIVNPTAGLLAGDRIEVAIAVETGARLVLTAPSASRAHTMRSGGAELEQRFTVAEGAFLESLPELLIPQAGSRYRQRTHVEIAHGGTGFIWEMIAPGRVASGEAWAFHELAWATDLRLAGRLVARERYRLFPGSPAIESLRAIFPAAYFASCLVVSSTLSAATAARIHALHTELAWVGCSVFQEGGWSIRIIAAGSIALRRTVAAIRRELYAGLETPAPDLRRAVPFG